MTVSTDNKSTIISASSKSDSNNPKGCEEMMAVGDAIHKLITKTLKSMSRDERQAIIFTHPALKLFTQSQVLKLQTNFAVNDLIVQHSPETIDFKPVVKLFMPDGNCTWLLTELSSDLIAFGLCDLGFGSPEIGYVSLLEIYSLRGRYGLPVEKDKSFESDKTLTQYAKLARMEGRITD